jgi:hypothetical protein
MGKSVGCRGRCDHSAAADRIQNDVEELGAFLVDVGVEVVPLSKMQHDTVLGSRIAEVHSGSSLFTGDAGQGESNIRRWIFKNEAFGYWKVVVERPLRLPATQPRPH